MSSTPTPPAFDDHERGTAWTAVVGLVLLWGAFIAVAYFSTLLSLWFLATLDAGAELGPGDIMISVASGVVPLALGLVVLVCASLRQRWARWVAVVAGIGIGLLGVGVLWATMSPAPETLLMAGAAIAGGILLALPTRGRWHGPRAVAAPEPLPA